MAAPSGREGPDDTECVSRACFDTQTWVKRFGKKKRGQPESNSSSNGMDANGTDGGKNRECPLDKDELGRNTWSFLHTMAANYPTNPTKEQQENMKEFMNLFGKFFPCDYCAKDFRKNLKKYEPDTRDQDSFSQWMCRMHNIVNVRIGKPEFDCSLVNERWRDGWKDGSCDD